MAIQQTIARHVSETKLLAMGLEEIVAYVTRIGPTPEGHRASEAKGGEFFIGHAFTGSNNITDLECIDENMNVYFEMLKSELEDSEGGRRLATLRLACFMANPQRKDKIEFHWNKLSPAEKAEFRRAMTKEAIHWKQ